MKAIGKKLDRYKNPWLELKIQYGQNKGKLYNEECDRFMVCYLFIVDVMVVIPNNVYWTISSSDIYVLYLKHRYAWFTSLDMETGMSSRQHFVHHPYFDLIGLWSLVPPKNLLGDVIPSFGWWRRKTKNMMRGRDRPGKRRNLPRFYHLSFMLCFIFAVISSCDIFYLRIDVSSSYILYQLNDTKNWKK